jgi:hypothetical protein
MCNVQFGETTMSNIGGNAARLYLPLLNHSQAEVRRYACAILLGAHGTSALTALRCLLNDADPAVRQQARQGLHAIATISGNEIAEQPYHGIYIECLGQLRVWIGGRQILLRDWMQADSGRAGWRKVQGAFAYLVHRGRYGTSRKALGEAVWGGPVSAASLARTLTALRQTLAGTDDAPLSERALTISTRLIRNLMLTEKIQICAHILGYSGLWLLVQCNSGECNNSTLTANFSSLCIVFTLRAKKRYTNQLSLSFVFALYERKNEGRKMDRTPNKP